MFIAEQQLVAAAVGFSVRHYIPFASTFAAFFTRAHDFIRMAAISQANICLVGSHAGVEIGADGPSQMALEDLAMMRCHPRRDGAISQRRDERSCAGRGDGRPQPGFVTCEPPAALTRSYTGRRQPSPSVALTPWIVGRRPGHPRRRRRHGPANASPAADSLRREGDRRAGARHVLHQADRSLDTHRCGTRYRWAPRRRGGSSPRGRARLLRCSKPSPGRSQPHFGWCTSRFAFCRDRARPYRTTRRPAEIDAPAIERAARDLLGR